MGKRKLVDFDTFAYCCHYFNSNTEVNNGYGCSHPNQESVSEGAEGKEEGCCYASSCPLCCTFDEEDLNNPELDFDGHSIESFSAEDGSFLGEDFVTVDASPEATDDEKKALDAYNRYLNRYNNN